MAIQGGSIKCDVCGEMVGLNALFFDEDSDKHPTTFRNFDFSLDGGTTNRVMQACSRCFEAGYVQQMMEQNSPDPLPDGPLKKAINNALAGAQP